MLFELFFSHEMQHYLSGLQSYIYNQIIQVAWQELQTNLNDVKSLDNLIQAHEAYIDYALQRCFSISLVFLFLICNFLRSNFLCLFPKISQVSFSSSILIHH